MELKWEIWKNGSNLETWSKLRKWKKWWFPKWDFLSYEKWFRKWFYCKNPNIISKWFSQFKRALLVDFSMNHGSMELKGDGFENLRVFFRLFGL